MAAAEAFGLFEDVIQQDVIQLGAKAERGVFFLRSI
jgi:hypothetical protein